MKTHYIVLLLLIIDSGVSFSQSYETVNVKELTGTADKSYVVNQWGALKPSFTHNAATQGPFFLRAKGTGEGTGESYPIIRGKNVVVSESPLIAVTSLADLSGLFYTQKNTTFSYVDGLGRSVQEIGMRQSPLSYDLIDYKVYDEHGRVSEVRLPFVSTQQNGQFKDKTTSNAEQSSFYTTSPKVAVDSKPYGYLTYESSPLNRVLNTYGAGASWHATGNNKPVSSISRTNLASEVLLWSYDGSSAPPATTQFYPANALTVSETTDEMGVVTRAYKDFRDLLILTVRDATDGAFNVYQIYDISGNLRFVLPPEAVNRLSAEYSHVSITDPQRTDFLNRWAFQYEYDDFGRLIKKRAPGSSDWTLMVYDKWDRLVLAREPGWATNEWLFTKYDLFNRAIMTGIYTTSTSHSQLQSNAMASTVHHENPIANNVTGYGLSNTFPMAVTEADLRMVNYYDTYDFIYSGWDEQSLSYSFTSSDKLNSVKGYITGTKVRVLGTSRWINSVTYYDKKYRELHTIDENYYGGADKYTTTYDFSGKITSAIHVHTSSSENITILEEFEYDHGGRLLSKYQTIDSGPRTLLASNQYNELGQVVEKNVHSVSNSPFLQSVDYRYTIRGWLSSINNATLTSDANNNDTNDLFGMDILFNQTETINASPTTAQFGGNISAIRWKTNNLKDSPKEQVFGFTYDKLNRLTSNRYAEKSGGTWSGSLDKYKESMTYDRNGNIKTLGRWINYNGITTQVDNLSYAYGSNVAGDNWGNRLFNVHDNSAYYNSGDKNTAYGFAETTHDAQLQEYTYDNSGRMTSDLNREITSITYNFLNMPEVIQLSGNRRIEYTYDAAGNKLRTVAKENGSTIHQTDYVGSFFYVNSALNFITHSEGRAVKNNSGGFSYEYFLKDHQGNTRVVFGSLKETKEYRATMETSMTNQEEIANDPVNGFRNLAATRIQAYNHTRKNSQLIVTDRSAETNGNISGKTVGPAKMLQVTSGDRIQLEVFARYQTGIGSNTALVSGLAAAVTGAFGMVSGETSHTALTNAMPGQAATVPAVSSVAKAYLCYILFDANYVFRQFGYARISSVAASQHERLFIDATLPYSGFVYVFVANESNVSGSTSVYFDDLSIIHERNNPTLQVTQSNDYLPFGLSINEYYQNRAGDTGLPYSQNKYKFQAQEVQTGHDLGWYHLNLRMYDPALGRFSLTDPLAEKFLDNSPYNFTFNNPVLYVDPNGDAPYVHWAVMWEFSNMVNARAEQTYSRYMQMGYNGSYAVQQKLWAPMLEQWREQQYDRNPKYNPYQSYGEQMASGKYGLAVQIAHHIGPMIPVVGGVASGLIEARKGNYGKAALDIGVGATELTALLKGVPLIGNATKGGSSTIFRAVSQAEVDDIAKFGFRMKAGGYESGKLFAPTLREVTQFGKYNFGLDGIPNIIMKVRVPNSVLNGATKFGADGMNAISIPANQLNFLRGTPLNYSPLIR